MHGGSNDVNAAVEIPCAGQSDTKLLSRDVRREYNPVFVSMPDSWPFFLDSFKYEKIPVVLASHYRPLGRSIRHSNYLIDKYASDKRNCLSFETVGTVGSSSNIGCSLDAYWHAVLILLGLDVRQRAALPIF